MNTALSIKVYSEGVEVGSSFQLSGLDIALELNHIPWARLSFLDNYSDKPEFQVANSSEFKPGSSVEIKLAYLQPGGPAKQSFVFKGLVTGHSLEVDGGKSLSVIELRDKAFGMTRGRQCQFFEDMTDSDIFGKLIGQYSGLSKGKSETTSVKHEKMLQYDCTDWDFMLLRAEANGLLVAVQNNSVSLLKANASPTTTHSLDYGIGQIYNLEIEADGSDQAGKTLAVGWDYKTQKRLESAPPPPFRLAQGNLDGAAIAGDLAPAPAQLLNGVAAQQPELDAWAAARQVRSRLSLFRGRVSAMGMPTVKLGDSLKLKGLGARFDGKALISGIRHRVGFDGWQTDLQLGMAEKPFYQNEHIGAPAAAGLLPGVHGLQVGVVAPFEEDPQKEFRVRVKLPALSAEEKSILWARLAVPDGGKGRGWFFYPEPDDEVLVGFLNGDPRQPIVLGALFGSKHSPPADLETLDAENAKKGITTKGGHSILFDDTEQLLTIQTADPPPSGDEEGGGGAGGGDEAKMNTFILDHKNGKIDIKDKNGNSCSMTEEGISFKSEKGKFEFQDKDGNTITLNEDGIGFKSDKAFKVEVSGNELVLDSNGIQISSGGKMALKASGKVEVEGASIDLK